MIQLYHSWVYAKTDHSQHKVEISHSTYYCAIHISSVLKSAQADYEQMTHEQIKKMQWETKWSLD